MESWLMAANVYGVRENVTTKEEQGVLETMFCILIMVEVTLIYPSVKIYRTVQVGFTVH